MAIISFFESLFTQDSFGEDRLFFVETSKITDREYSKSGILEKLVLTEGSVFREIKLTTKPKIVNMQRGANKIIQDLQLDYNNGSAISGILEQIKVNNKTVTIIHLNPTKQAFIYGEHKGLTVMELTENKLMLEGEEADIFFKVSAEVVSELKLI